MPWVFKGAPVIRLLDTSRRPQAETPTQGDYILCINDEIKTLHVNGENKPSDYNIITEFAAMFASESECGSLDLYSYYFQKITEILPKFSDEDRYTQPVQMKFPASNNKKSCSFAVNYPIYPLEWCQPSTQRMVFLENKEDTSDLHSTLSPDSFQRESNSEISGQNGSIATSGDAVEPRKKVIG